MKIHAVLLTLMALVLLVSCVVPLSNTGMAVVRLVPGTPEHGRFLAAETSRYRVAIQPEKGEDVLRNFSAEDSMVVEVSPGQATILIDVFDKDNSILTHGEATQTLVSGPNEIQLTLEPARIFESDKPLPLLAHQLAYFQLNNDTDKAFGAEVGSTTNTAMFWPVKADGTWDPSKGGTSGGVDVFPGEHLIIRVLQGDENGLVGYHAGPVGSGGGGGGNTEFPVIINSDIVALWAPATVNRLEGLGGIDFKFQLGAGVSMTAVYLDGTYYVAPNPSDPLVSSKLDGKGGASVNVNMWGAGLKTGVHHVSILFLDSLGVIWSYDRNVALIEAQPLVLSASATNNAIIKPDGTLWTWNQGDSPGQVGSETTWKSVSTSGPSFAALKHDSSAWTWGDNSYGQLGLGDSISRSVPTLQGPILAVTTWDAVAAGPDHVLFLAGNGNVLGAGSVTNAQLGPAAASQIPVSVMTGMSVLRVWVGNQFSASIENGGILRTWGRNDRGQLGDAQNFAGVAGPISPAPGIKWRMVALGNNHVVGIRDDGTLWSWGDNTSGQLGKGSTDNLTTLPTQVFVPADPKKPGMLRDLSWQDVAAGTNLSWGLQYDGSLWVWGAGFGNVPQQWGKDQDWMRLSGGGSHLLAAKRDGTVWTWESAGLAPVKVVP